MADLSYITSPEMVDSPSARRYAEMIEQSREARRCGDHWAAQQFATAAHKWALDEHTRLQRLAHARESLAAAGRQLQTVWDKHPECATIAELLDSHPEFKRVITARDAAEQRVGDLEQSPTSDVAILTRPQSAW